jgi:hypothetical protein
VHEAAQSASNNEETAFNGGLAFGGFPGAISHDGANPADGNNATAEPISSIASATGTATKTRLTDEMQELVLKLYVKAICSHPFRQKLMRRKLQ